jgi:hypothetical protein
MVEIINTWELIEHYCQSNGKSVILFRNEKVKLASAEKQQEIWTWYEEFTDDSILDAMKTMGTWDIAVFDNEDVATQNALAWFPAKEFCPDEDYYWECHVINEEGDFVWRNADASHLTTPPGSPIVEETNNNDDEGSDTV